MKEGEEYEDYLVDKAKELLREDMESSAEVDSKIEKPEMKNKQNQLDEKAEKESTSEIPYTFDPREIEFLAENRKEMTNEELEEFLRKDSDVHEKLEDVDEWNGFSRWEERFMVQNHNSKSPGEIAEELDRDEDEVELKMRMLGLQPEV
ncbi:MAG: hypothetical protein ABEJ98_01435 [Candidatus Nanohaloarchaea archaeon]